MKREAVIDPSLEKTLLCLHAAMNLGSFWKAIQQLLAAAIPNRLIGLMLQPNPILPMITRWTLPVPDGFFAATPLKSYIAAQPRQRFVQISELFSNRSSLVKSAFYRRYMAPQKCAHAVCLLFWQGHRLICVIAIMRTATQGDLSLDLKPIYQNRAARDFCAVWEKGPEEAQLTKATSPIPSEILDRCRQLKQQWKEAQPRTLSGPQTRFKEERVHHPRSPHLRATLHLKQLGSAGVARPHFLIECEDLRSSTAPRTGPASSRLPHLVRLTRREQEVARLVCEGRSNQEIADDACLSLAMVKKHLHAVFRKLEVPSRSRLIALMR